MANEMAQKLGYTNREAVSGKHIAMNMNLTNAIRMGLVVNPKLVSCVYNLKSDGSLDELKDNIEQIEDIEDRNKKLEEYEALRRKIEKAEGISEILQKNVKRGGKYIVFLPVAENLEDEDANVIGRKKAKEKIKDYEKQIAEYFKDSGIVPNFHSMLGEYGDKENARQLEEFENSNTDSTDFMLVMNKANEGLHLEKLDGMIWLRPMDENSRILYLQQLGRVIYSEDPDNPTKDEDRPVVIDLVNNTLKVMWDLEPTEQDDIEMLNLIVEWYNRHNEKIPNINSKEKDEAGYGALLISIQEKYKKYLEGDFEDLNEKQIGEVREIIEIGSQIDLWQIDLPKPEKKEGNLRNSTGDFSSEKTGLFEISSLLQDFVKLEKELDDSNIKNISLKNALQIKAWCERNYGDKEIWERKLPSTTAKDKDEKDLGKKLNNIKTKIKPYEGMPLEEIKNEEDKKIVEIIRQLDEEYGLGQSLKNALEIKAWCEKNYGDKEIWERRLPWSTAKNNDEKKLGRNLGDLRTRKIKQYEEMPLEAIENEEDRKIVEIIRKLDEEYGLGQALKNALEIKVWCEKNYGDKEIWERRLPWSTAKNKYEKELGKKLSHIRTKIKQYEGMPLDEIKNEEDRKIVEIIRQLDEEYGLGVSLKNVLAIKVWCERNFENKQIWERRLPSSTAKDKDEKDLGSKLIEIRSKKIKPYEGVSLEDIENEEDRRIVKIIRQLDQEYGLGQALKNALQIKAWCERNYGDKEIWERRLPWATAKDKAEKDLGQKLNTIRAKIKPYEGMPLEEIENEEDRRTVEIIRKLDEEYGLGQALKNALQIKMWCERNYGDKEIWERKLPSLTAKDKAEKDLGQKLNSIRAKIKPYEGMPLEEIENEEDRRTVEIIRKLDEEYGLGQALKNALQIKMWCERNYGDKEIWERKLPSLTAKDKAEKDLGNKLKTIRKKIKPYEGVSLEEIENEEDRRIVEIIRYLDEQYNPRKLKGKDIAKASISSITNPELLDREDVELKALVERTREGGISQDEQPK